MKVLGIIGGIGAGKTTLVTLLEEMKKTYVISADRIGHQILLKGEWAYELVVEHFGKKILDEEGKIIRKKLGKIVFGNPKELTILNSITHPIIYQQVAKEIEKCKQLEGVEIVVIDAALLIEIGLVKLTDKVIGVYAEEDVRVDRIMKREHYTKEEALLRIKAQKKWEELERVCDETINNSYSIQNTKEQLEKILNSW